MARGKNFDQTVDEVLAELKSRGLLRDSESVPQNENRKAAFEIIVRELDLCKNRYIRI